MSAVTLRIYADPEGGVSLQWTGKAAESSRDPFFIFGKCGGGFMPLWDMKRDRQKIEIRAEECVKSAQNRGYSARISYRAPGKK